MKPEKKIYNFYASNFKEGRRFYGSIIGVLLVISLLLSLKGLENGLNYTETLATYNYFIGAIGILVLLLVLLRYKWIDMKYIEENDNTMSELMRYTPMKQQHMHSYCNKKMWYFSVGISVVFLGGTYLVTRQWGYLTDFAFSYAIQITILEILVIVITTILLQMLSYKAEQKSNTFQKLITGVICCTILVFGICNLPWITAVDKQVAGFVVNLEDDQYKEASLVVNGQFYRYLLKGNEFKGIIYSEELEFNEEQDEVTYVQTDKSGILAASHIIIEPFSIETELLGMLDTDATFERVVLQLYDRIEQEGNSTAYYHEKCFFVGNVATPEEAREQGRVQEGIENTLKRQLSLRYGTLNQIEILKTYTQEDRKSTVMKIESDSIGHRYVVANYERNIEEQQWELWEVSELIMDDGLVYLEWNGLEEFYMIVVENEFASELQITTADGKRILESIAIDEIPFVYRIKRSNSYMIRVMNEDGGVLWER